MNHLVSKWAAFFSENFGEKIHIKVRDTDILDWDVMLEQEVVSYAGAPQTNLVHLASIRGIRDTSSYIVWVTKWDEDEPFVLSTIPDRKLEKGGYYYRYLPIEHSGQPAFVLDNDPTDLTFLKQSDIGAVFLKGWNIMQLIHLYATVPIKHPLLVHWRSWSELNTFLDGTKCTELGLFQLGEDSAMMVIRTDANVLHLLLCVAERCSLASNAVVEANDGISQLRASNQEATAIRTIFIHAETM